VDVVEPGPLLDDLKRTLRRHMLRELPLDKSCTLRDLDFDRCTRSTRRDHGFLL
jgi:hypothetical protein